MPSFACIVLKYDFVCVYSFDLCCLWCLLNRCHLYFQLKPPYTIRTCCSFSTKSMVHNSFKSGTSMGVDCELASPFHKRSRLKNVWCSKWTFWVCGWCQLFEKIFLWYCKPWDSELFSLYVNGRYYVLWPRLYNAPNEVKMTFCIFVYDAPEGLFMLHPASCIPHGTVGTFSSDISLGTLTECGTSVFLTVVKFMTCRSASHPVNCIIGQSPDNQ